MNLQEIRNQYPQYSDLSDQELADSLYQKHYSDMDRGDFDSKIGLQAPNDQARAFNEKYGLPGFLGVPEGYGPVAHGIDQGAALALGDEITAGGAAAAAKAKSLFTGDDVDFSDAYQEALSAKRGQAGRFREENPETALTAELIGGVATGGAGAKRVLGSRAMQTASQAAPRLTRTAAISGTGAAAGGTYGFGEGEGLEDSLDRAKTGATVAAVASPVGAKLANSAVNALARRRINKLTQAAAPSVDQVKQQAGDLYEQAKKLGVTVSNDSYGGLLERLSTTVDDIGFHPKLHPKVAASLEEFAQREADDVDLGDLDRLRRIMGSAAGSNEADERRIAKALINEIDDYVDNLADADLVSGRAGDVGQTLTKARSLWQVKRKGDLIEEAIKKAKDQASGFENGLRIQFRKILNSPKKMRGFTAEETDAMRKIVRGGTGENIARLLGKLAPNEGSATNYLGMVTGIAGGATVGGPVGAVAAPLIGMVSRNTAQRMTRGNVANLDALVRSGGRDQLARLLAESGQSQALQKQLGRISNTTNRDALATALSAYLAGGE